MEEIDHTSIFDTSEMDNVPGVGFVEDGQFVTYHVTDDPKGVRAKLSRPGVRLMAAYGKKGRTSELGPGLYVSGNPHYWVSRASGKWDFLKRLDSNQVLDLTEKLLVLIKKEKDKRFLSQSEYERAVRDIGLVVDGIYDAETLISLANQPYNIKFWKPEFLRSIDIEPGREPSVVEIRIEGLLADIRSGHDPELFRRLRKAGVAGAFTRAGMSTNPELVLWDARAIRSVREVPLD
jgi:hypothetical protein